MTSPRLIGAAELRALLAGADPPVLIDARLRPRRHRGRRARLRAPATCPARIYLHLDRDLCGAEDRPQRPPSAARTRRLRRARSAARHRRRRPRSSPTTARAACYAARALVDAALARPCRRWRCSTAGSPAWRAAGGALVDRHGPRPRPAPPYPERASRCASSVDADALLRAPRPRARCSMRARPSASAARSSRSTRWPATSPAPSTASIKDNLRRRRPLQAGGAAARRIRRRCSAAARRAARAPVRLGRHRLPQPAGDGARRAGRLAALSGLVERVVVRPGAAGRARG